MNIMPAKCMTCRLQEQFKVMSCMAQGHQVQVILKPEQSNPYDAGMIAAAVGHTLETVGYIPKELTKYPALRHNSIVKVEAQQIKFGVLNPPGFYMRFLKINKKGRWDNVVVV